VTLIAQDLGDRLVYHWQPLRRGMVRKTLGADACDVLAGVPVGMEGVATTSAYYRSGYVFVTKRDSGPPIRSFDDPRLRRSSIGVELVGADMAGTPAALALARHGFIEHVTGYPLYGTKPAAERMVEALDDGTLDVAIAWGPQIGYFAHHAKSPLVVSFVPDVEAEPMTFAIALGVRKDDTRLRDEIDRALEHVRVRIAETLDAFDVPVVGGPPGMEASPP
jgi:mxaJ protein